MFFCVYYVGFFYGFNVVEAVNFGYVNWFDFGCWVIDVYSIGLFKCNVVFVYYCFVLCVVEIFVEVLGKNVRLVKSKVMGVIVLTFRKEFEMILSDEEIYCVFFVCCGLNIEIV